MHRYLTFLLRSHVLISIVLIVVFLAAGVVARFAGAHGLADSLVGVGLAGPFVLLMLLIRRAFYVRLQPLWPLAGGVAYLVLSAFSLYALKAVGVLTPLTAFLALGAASTVVSLLLLLRLRSIWPADAAAGQEVSARVMAADHWRYGRWSSAAVPLVWLPWHFYYVVLPGFTGFESAAALRALMNLILPVLHVFTAMSALIVPSLAREQNRGPFASRTSRAFLSLAGFLVTSLVYSVALWVFGGEITSWLYRGKYDQYVYLLRLAALVPLLGAISNALAAHFRASQRPHVVFWSGVISTVVTLTVGLSLSLKLGVLGAVEGIVASHIASAVSLAIFAFRRKATESLAKT